MHPLFRRAAQTFSRRLKHADNVNYEKARLLRIPSVLSQAFSEMRNMTFAAGFMVSGVHQYQQDPDIRRLLSPAKNRKTPLPPLGALPTFGALEAAISTNLHILETCNKKGTVTPTELNVMSEIYDRTAEFLEAITTKPEQAPYVVAITYISAHEYQDNKRATHFDHLDNILQHMQQAPHIRNIVRSIDRAALRGHMKKLTP